MLRSAAFLIVSAWLSIAAVPAGAQPVSDWRPLAVGALAAGATETIIDLRQARQGSEAIRLETPAVNGDTTAARIEIKSVELIYAGGATVLVAEPFIVETGRPSQPIAERIADRKIDQIKITLTRPQAAATAIEVTGRGGPAAPADRPRVATSTRGLDAVPPPAPPTPSSSPAPDATRQAPPPAKPNTRGLNKQPAPTTRGGPVESRGAGAQNLRLELFQQRIGHGQRVISAGTFWDDAQRLTGRPNRQLGCGKPRL